MTALLYALGNHQFNHYQSLTFDTIIRHPMFNSSFTMNQVHADGILCGQALRKMLGAVSGPVLTAGAAETDLQMHEATLEEALHMRIDQ